MNFARDSVRLRQMARSLAEAAGDVCSESFSSGVDFRRQRPALVINFPIHLAPDRQIVDGRWRQSSVHVGGGGMPDQIVRDWRMRGRNSVLGQKPLNILVESFLPQDERYSRSALPDERRRPQIEMQTTREMIDASHGKLGAVPEFGLRRTQGLGELDRKRG